MADFGGYFSADSDEEPTRASTSSVLRVPEPRQTPPPLRQRARARVVKAVEGVPEEAAADEPRHKFAAQRAAAAARRRQQ